MNWKFWRRHRPAHIEVVLGDITEQRVDAIVNAAKPSLMGGGGVDGAIHAAGGPAILAQCTALRASTFPNGLPVGDATATTAGRMKALWVIHTVGPVYSRDTDRSDRLRSCYTRSLKIADDLGAQTIAFPLISAGAYGWPREDAIAQALSAIRCARTNVKIVRLVFFDKASYSIAQELIGLAR